MLFTNTNLYSNFARSPFYNRTLNTSTAALMRTDIHEKDGQYQLNIDLPGYSKENIKAELKDGYLTISAGKEETQEEKSEHGQILRQERYQGLQKRSFYIGDGYAEEDIKASYVDGVLNLNLPKEAPKALVEEKKYIAIA
ncbi:MAG: Hsp20/alpha crystallin family protein [Lachnospiraceae bacterium]|nr:Hsp20/alpha crystallin family protein [Lachnospiraceae bacterium]